MRQTRRWKRGALGVLVCGLLALGLWRLVPRERRILDLATPVASVTGWQSDGTTWEGFPFYCWFSDQEVLRLRGDIKTGYQLCRQQVGPGHQDAAPVPLPIPLIRPGMNLKNISPDGKWITYRQRMPGKKRQLFVFALDGSRVLTRPRISVRGAAIWLPDSRRWAEVDERYTDTIVLHGVDSEQAEIKMFAELHSAIPPILKVQQGAQWPFSNTLLTLLGRGAQGRLLVSQGMPVFSRRMAAALHIPGYKLPTLLELDLVTGRVARRFAMNSPDLDFTAPMISPQGDRLLWGGSTTYISPLQRQMRRWLPWVHPKPTYMASWWVSDLDGSNLHEIGHQIGAKDGYSPIEDFPQWTPDGKRVSFAYRGKLYTMPAE